MWTAIVESALNGRGVNVQGSEAVKSRAGTVLFTSRLYVFKRLNMAPAVAVLSALLLLELITNPNPRISRRRKN